MLCIYLVSVNSQCGLQVLLHISSSLSVGIYFLSRDLFTCNLVVGNGAFGQVFPPEGCWLVWGLSVPGDHQGAIGAGGHWHVLSA